MTRGSLLSLLTISASLLGCATTSPAPERIVVPCQCPAMPRLPAHLDVDPPTMYLISDAPSKD